MLIRGGIKGSKELSRYLNQYKDSDKRRGSYKISILCVYMHKLIVLITALVCSEQLKYIIV